MTEAEMMRRLVPRLGAFGGGILIIVSAFLPWVSVAFLGDLNLFNLAAVTAEGDDGDSSPLGIVVLLITLGLGGFSLKLAIHRGNLRSSTVAWHGVACIAWVVLLILGMRELVESFNGPASLASGGFVALVGGAMNVLTGMVAVGSGGEAVDSGGEREATGTLAALSGSGWSVSSAHEAFDD